MGRGGWRRSSDVRVGLTVEGTGLQFFFSPERGQRVNIFVFWGYTVSASTITTQLYHRQDEFALDLRLKVVMINIFYLPKELSMESGTLSGQ